MHNGGGKKRERGGDLLEKKGVRGGAKQLNEKLGLRAMGAVVVQGEKKKGKLASPLVQTSKPRGTAHFLRVTRDKSSKRGGLYVRTGWGFLEGETNRGGEGVAG